MNHLPLMITDLAVILAAAAISILIFSRFKQPIVLGYLIAGFAVGPHVNFWPAVIDTEGVKLWAEIGVIFLLFGLGLEFSFKKLAQVGKSATITTCIEVSTMLMIGYLSGRAFGWNNFDSLYLGAILSISSTTIIIRALSEVGMKGKAFVSLVFGILIVEDLVAILIMIFLTEISGAAGFSAGNVVYLAARLGFFLLIWFLIGIYVLPSLLKKFRNHLSNEIMLILSISLCFIMVVLASKAGFSAALGAFIMGSILAETQEGERIENLIGGVKDLFAAVFFVSVGMLIDPYVLSENLGIVLLLTFILIIGKFIGPCLGAILSGQSLKRSVQTAMSLGQIGEFSFIIATLGLTLKVTSPFLFPIVIAVSAVTTFTTPFMIRFSEPFYNWFESRIPQRILKSLDRYEQVMTSTSQTGVFTLFWRTYGLVILLNSVVIIAIALATGEYLFPLMVQTFGDSLLIRVCAGILAILFCSPFLGALILKAPKNLSDEEISTLTRLKRLQFGLLIFRFLIAFLLILFTVKQFSKTESLLFVVIFMGTIFIISLRKFIKPVYTAVEKRFFENLNSKERAAIEKMIHLPELAPWEATLVHFLISSDSAIAGLTIEETRFRTTTGATIAMIIRGSRKIFAPGRGERILPNDQLFLIGTEEQLAAAQNLIEVKHDAKQAQNSEMYNLESVYIDEKSIFANKSIREIGIGESLGLLIMGIERQDQRILNPESYIVIKPGDLIWVFGTGDQINELCSKLT